MEFAARLVFDCIVLRTFCVNILVKRNPRFFIKEGTELPPLEKGD